MRSAVADETSVAEMRPPKTQTILAHPAIGERTRSRQSIEHAGETMIALQQALQPCDERLGTSGKASGGGKMQTGGGQLPALIGFPIAGCQADNRIVPDIRRGQRKPQMPGGLLHEVVETQTLSRQCSLDQSVAGIGVGHFRTGGEIQPRLARNIVQQGLSLRLAVDRQAKQREALTHVRQTSAHIQRLTDRDIA